MAKVLLYTLVFPPDSVSTSLLFGDIVKELKKLGHDITVLTTTPHYNKEQEALTLQPMHKKWAGLIYKSDYFGIPVYHVSMSSKGSSISSRLLNYTRFHIISSITGLIITRRYDIILTPSPPLTIGFNAWLLGLKRNVPFIYNVQEIYPDVAIKLGVLCNSRVIRAIECLERFIYNRARVLVVISDSFHFRLLTKGAPAEKLSVIPNFVDTEFIKPGSKNNAFAHIYGLHNQFVVLYAGNIGLTQSFETIIAAAGNLRHLPNLRFLIIGNGTRQAWLKKELEKQRLSNITLLPYQPHRIVPQIYSSSNICLVPLKRDTALDTFPSKIYTIMAAGRPAIVSADNDSELTSIVKRAYCGLVVPPENIGALINSITYAYHHQDKLYKMGNNGRNYVVTHHTRQAIGLQYHKLINKIVLSRA